MQPCGGHEAEPTLLESRPEWGLQVRTLGSHTCSTSGEPIEHSQMKDEVKFTESFTLNTLDSAKVNHLS